MNFWKIFNYAEFEATGLVSWSLTLLLGDVGEREILVVRGNVISVVFDGVMLPITVGANPYTRDGYTIYRDASDDVWLGIEADE